jgi:hypothetical protein
VSALSSSSPEILESAKHPGHGVYSNQEGRRPGNHSNASTQLRASGKTFGVVTSGVRVPPSDRGRVADNLGVIDWRLECNAKCGHFRHRANPRFDQEDTDECRQAEGEEQLLKEVRQSYDGKVVVGHDLEIF